METFARRYRAEMKRPEAAQALDLLAALSRAHELLRSAATARTRLVAIARSAPLAAPSRGVLVSPEQQALWDEAEAQLGFHARPGHDWVDTLNRLWRKNRFVMSMDGVLKLPNRRRS